MQHFLSEKDLNNINAFMIYHNCSYKKALEKICELAKKLDVTFWEALEADLTVHKEL